MNEHYSRVRSMILDDGGTWDLSPNDKTALRHVLGLVVLLAENIGEHTGLPIGEVIENYSARVVAADEAESNAT